MNPTPASRPPAWDLLERAVAHRRAVRANYHGHERLLCPHALGWKNGRAKLLAYQSARTTSTGELPGEQQRWRSMLVDDIEHPALTDDHWETADNYTPHSNCIDHLVAYIPPK